MSSSIDNADNITHAEVLDDGAIIEETAVKQLETAVKQLMEHLSIENKEEDNTDNITSCAACGNEGDSESMNTCNKCKMVHYCNAACKKKHKSKHKKKCDRRVAELYDEALFKEPPPREDCPICMLPLPLYVGQTEFKSCCGKSICGGCTYAMMIEDIKKGKKMEEMGMCAFCRTLRSSSDEEKVKRLKRQIEKGNANAFYNFGQCYAQGSEGIPQDWAKANELWLKAGELGCSDAYFNLGNSYNNGRGVEMDKEKAKYFWELAAIGGSIKARQSLCSAEALSGNYQRGIKHIMIAARAGDEESLDAVKLGYMDGFITKDEYASTLRVYHERQSEMKSEARDTFADADF